MAKSQTKESSGAGGADRLLTEDHRKVQKMFDEFNKLENGDMEEKEDLVRMACTELRIHAMLEEEIFYPAVREELDEKSLIDEAEVEHTVAKQLIGELEEMSPDEDLYDAKFTVLGEYVKHHIAEEEKEIFPKAKRAKVDMQALGEQLEKRKQELLQEMGVMSEE
jgi:hemerythrin-like domain-containing protein